MCHCFCCCRYIFRKISWHILSGFSPLFFLFVIFLAIVKTDVKNNFWRVYFSRPACHFFFIVLVPFSCYMLWLGFVFKKEHCPLCSEFLTVRCYAQKLYADAFPMPLNFFSDRTRYDFVLSLACKHWNHNSNQKQHEFTLR